MAISAPAPSWAALPVAGLRGLATTSTGCPIMGRNDRVGEPARRDPSAVTMNGLPRHHAGYHLPPPRAAGFLVGGPYRRRSEIQRERQAGTNTGQHRCEYRSPSHQDHLRTGGLDLIGVFRRDPAHLRYDSIGTDEQANRVQFFSAIHSSPRFRPKFRPSRPLRARCALRSPARRYACRVSPGARHAP